MNFKNIFAPIVLTIFFITGITLAGANKEDNPHVTKNIVVSIKGVEGEPSYSATLLKLIYQKVIQVENSHILMSDQLELRKHLTGSDVYLIEIIFTRGDQVSSIKAQLFNESQKKVIKRLKKNSIPNGELIKFTEKAMNILISEFDEVD